MNEGKGNDVRAKILLEIRVDWQDAKLFLPPLLPQGTGQQARENEEEMKEKSWWLSKGLIKEKMVEEIAANSLFLYLSRFSQGEWKKKRKSDERKGEFVWFYKQIKVNYE